jgi:Papain family cysteine protease
MDSRQFIKLKRFAHDWKGRDYSHAKTFGANPTQPKNWLTRILNQGASPSCTAYTAVGLREAQTGRQYDPEAQWKEELAFVGNPNAQGVDLDSQMAVGVEKGFVPVGQTQPVDQAGGWMNVHPTQTLFNPSGMDTFDAIKDALKVAPLSVGLTWYSEWDNTPQGIIPHTFLNKLGDHDTKVAYVSNIEIVGGVEYLVIQGTWGEGFGDAGKFRFDRYMANKCLTLGIKYWTDNVPLDVQRLGLLLSLYINLKNLLTQLTIQMGRALQMTGK